MPQTDTPKHDLLLHELEATLACGNIQHRLKILQRVTDLFIAGSRRYSGAEMAVFDDVLTRIAAEIETKARARLAQAMAERADAPPRLIRQLAFDDAIEVAAPVLTSSPQLADADLVENASTKSQDHLYAIAQRLTLNEVVTDVLIARGDRRVVHCAVGNKGARISDAGYQLLVKRANDDSKLALTMGRRTDIPRLYFLKLLETASTDVREKLEAMNPDAARAIRDVIADVASEMQREARETSRHHAGAERDARFLFRSHELTEANVHTPARSQQFEKTAAALAMLGPFPIDLVERALIDKGTEMILTLVRAADCSWVTAKAALTMHVAGRGMSQQDMQAASAAFDRLSPETARRVVKFYELRTSRKEDAAAAAPERAAAATAGMTSKWLKQARP